MSREGNKLQHLLKNLHAASARVVQTCLHRNHKRSWDANQGSGLGATLEGLHKVWTDGHTLTKLRMETAFRET